MKMHDRVSTEMGDGVLYEFNPREDEWLVWMDDGGTLSFKESELTFLPEHKGYAESGHDTSRFTHLYEVQQGLRFINQLKQRGDEPGDMMHDILAPLAVEIAYLREELAKRQQGL